MTKSAHPIFRLPDFSRQPGLGFILKRSGPFRNEVELKRDRVYILPTGAGILFAVLIFVLLTGSINYGKSLGYILTFLLFGIGNVLLYATWRNLAGLKVRAGGCQPVFAGETACFRFQLENPDDFTRLSVHLSQDGEKHDLVDIPPNRNIPIHLYVQTKKRGWQKSGRFRLYTQFPSGLFVAWTWIEFSTQCLVYPQPANSSGLVCQSTENDTLEDSKHRGTADFSHLDKFKPGENWRRICWKTAAKSNVLYSKQFSGNVPEQLWIDWHTIDAPTTERRIAIMTRLVLDCHQQQLEFGLILPGITLEAGSDGSHFHQCLKQLALFRPGHD